MGKMGARSSEGREWAPPTPSLSAIPHSWSPHGRDVHATQCPPCAGPSECPCAPQAPHHHNSALHNHPVSLPQHRKSKSSKVPLNQQTKPPCSGSFLASCDSGRAPLWLPAHLPCPHHRLAPTPTSLDHQIGWARGLPPPQPSRGILSDHHLWHKNKSCSFYSFPPATTKYLGRSG